MALEDIVLVDSDSANQTYSLIGGIGTDGRVTRRNFTASTPEEPIELAISHQTTGKSVKTDRHMIRLDVTKLDADEITPRKGSVWICWAVERQANDVVDMWDATSQLVSYLTEANVNATLLGKS